MEVYQLIYAATLAKYRNFSIAAEKLFITQPSLSQQIQKLEQELGFSIFYRNHKRVTLTYPGEQFLEHANKVIKEFEALKENIQSINNLMNGTVTFGTSTMSSPLVTESLQNFLAEFPLVNFKLMENDDLDLMEMVRAREIDLAIVAMPQAPSFRDGFRIIEIQEEQICAVLSKNHVLAKRDSIAIHDLTKEKLIFTSPKSIIRKLLLSIFEQYNFVPNVIMDLTSSTARLPMIKSGAITFSFLEQNAWRGQQDIVYIPIQPEVKAALSMILPEDATISFVLNTLMNTIFNGAKEKFKNDDPHDMKW
jgi:LysR family hydrogen peroxide-inducible transcriptional activator